MFATAPTGTTRPAHEETVRLRPGDLPVRPLPNTTNGNETKTTRLRSLDLPLKTLPKAIGGFDGKTVRLRPIDMPVVGKVANTVRQRYADLSKIQRLLTKWEIARLMLVLLLASIPIVGISVDVSGLVSQGTTSVVVIVLTAVLATLVVFAPHRTAMIVGRGLIAGMVACIVYDGARLFAVHVLGLMGRFHPRDGVVCHRRAGHRGQCGGRLYLAVHRRCRWTGCRLLHRRVRAGH